jgi:hypothetical protein
MRTLQITNVLNIANNPAIATETKRFLAALNTSGEPLESLSLLNAQQLPVCAQSMA